MNRLLFIRSLLGMAASSLVRPPEFLVPIRYSEIYSGFVAGYQYYKGPEIEKYFVEGDTLSLVREPFNPFDNRAIALYIDDLKIGFIPMANNEVLSKMIDAKIHLRGEITEINREEETWNRIKVAVFIHS